MASTILLDQTTWDLVLDADGNIAAAAGPYSLAQDAASAIRTFLGEVYLNTTLGVAYIELIFGKNPSIPVMKAQFVAAAMTVPDVASAECFISSITGRRVGGQVQVVSKATGEKSAAPFAVVNPQGAG